MIAWLGFGLPCLYVSTYLLLSVPGKYQLIHSGCIHQWEESTLWVPAFFPNLYPGAASPNPLSMGIMKFFYPLWTTDIQWLHNRKEVASRANLVENNHWVYETNTWTRDAKGDWIFTNYVPATVTGK
jgi:hypothetical protein